MLSIRDLRIICSVWITNSAVRISRFQFHYMFCETVFLSLKYYVSFTLLTKRFVISQSLVHFETWKINLRYSSFAGRNGYIFRHDSLKMTDDIEEAAAVTKIVDNKVIETTQFKLKTLCTLCGDIFFVLWNSLKKSLFFSLRWQKCVISLWLTRFLT